MLRTAAKKHCKDYYCDSIYRESRMTKRGIMFLGGV